jgi:hypothetical protein
MSVGQAATELLDAPDGRGACIGRGGVVPQAPPSHRCARDPRALALANVKAERIRAQGAEDALTIFVADRANVRRRGEPA